MSINIKGMDLPKDGESLLMIIKPNGEGEYKYSSMHFWEELKGVEILQQEQEAEEGAKQEDESMVCPWNGFRRCVEKRCPFWSLYGCRRVKMEIGR